MARRLSSPTPALPELPILPTWAREKSLSSQIDSAFSAGAGLATLSALVKSRPPYMGGLSERLSLQAATATNRSSGRSEDDEAIRDQWLLRPRGEGLSPAARVLSGWLVFSRLRADIQLLPPDMLEALAEAFGQPLDQSAEETLRELQAKVQSASNPVGAAALVSSAFYEREPRHEAIAHLLADLVLAQRLGWDRPLPLLASSIAVPSLRAGGLRRRPLPTDPRWETALFGAYALSCGKAFQLASYLRSRAVALLAIAPKLRSRHSDKVIDALLAHAFLPGSRTIGGMSDRAMRRIFDRLTDAGIVREVSGRATFRIYGL